MTIKRLFLHENDSTGIAVERDSELIVISWFDGAEIHWNPMNGNVSDEDVLDWVRHHIPYTEQESEVLGGYSVTNPLTLELEHYSNRGGVPPVYKLSSITPSSPTVVSKDNFHLSIEGAVVEIDSALFSPWCFLSLPKEDILSHLFPYFTSPQDISLLVRNSPSATIAVGQHSLLTRMGEEIPHPYRIIRISELGGKGENNERR